MWGGLDATLHWFRTPSICLRNKDLTGDLTPRQHGTLTTAKSNKFENRRNVRHACSVILCYNNIYRTLGIQQDHVYTVIFCYAPALSSWLQTWTLINMHDWFDNLKRLTIYPIKWEFTWTMTASTENNASCTRGAYWKLVTLPSELFPFVSWEFILWWGTAL